MVALTRAVHKANIDTDVLDNVTGLIDAADVRVNMKNGADSSKYPEDNPAVFMAGSTAIINPITDIIPSINGGDPALFDISAGVYVIADSFTDPLNPVETVITFPGVTAQTIVNLATDSETFLYLDNAGAVVQVTTQQGFDFLRDHVLVGILGHVNNATIDTVNSLTQSGLSNITMSFADHTFCIGAISCASGGQSKVSGNSGTLGLDKADGTWYAHAINARNDLKNPNIITQPALVQPSLGIGWRVTDNPEGKVILQNTIPAGVYDDGTAVFADALPQGTVNANDWVNHRLFIVVSTNQLLVQIGQVTYGMKSDAIANAGTEDFIQIPAFIGSTPLATITMRGAAADLSLSGDADIRQAIPPRATFQ